MNNTDTTSPHPSERIGMEHRRDGRDEIVVRLDWGTVLIAGVAFAIGVLVGFVLD